MPNRIGRHRGASRRQPVRGKTAVKGRKLSSGKETKARAKSGAKFFKEIGENYGKSLADLLVSTPQLEGKDQEDVRLNVDEQEAITRAAKKLDTLKSEGKTVTQLKEAAKTLIGETISLSNPKSLLKIVNKYYERNAKKSEAFKKSAEPIKKELDALLKEKPSKKMLGKAVKLIDKMIADKNINADDRGDLEILGSALGKELKALKKLAQGGQGLKVRLGEKKTKTREKALQSLDLAKARLDQAKGVDPGELQAAKTSVEFGKQMLELDGLAARFLRINEDLAVDQGLPQVKQDFQKAVLDYKKGLYEAFGKEDPKAQQEALSENGKKFSEAMKKAFDGLNIDLKGLGQVKEVLSRIGKYGSSWIDPKDAAMLEKLGGEFTAQTVLDRLMPLQDVLGIGKDKAIIKEMKGQHEALLNAVRGQGADSSKVLEMLGKATATMSSEMKAFKEGLDSLGNLYAEEDLQEFIQKAQDQQKFLVALLDMSKVAEDLMKISDKKDIVKELQVRVAGKEADLGQAQKAAAEAKNTGTKLGWAAAILSFTGIFGLIFGIAWAVSRSKAKNAAEAEKELLKALDNDKQALAQLKESFKLTTEDALKLF